MRDEVGRQRATVVEEIVERVGDVALILVQAAGAERPGAAGLAERGREVQDRVGCGVAEEGGEAGGEIAGGQSAERRR